MQRVRSKSVYLLGGEKIFWERHRVGMRKVNTRLYESLSQRSDYLGS